MPVDQWGNVIWTDEAGKAALEGVRAQEERNRQQKFAQWLQQQGMAPGENLPPETGGEFTGFLKAGGLKEFGEQEREKRSGQALADTYDEMGKHPKMAPYREMLNSLSGGLRTGGLTRTEAQATLKPVLDRAFQPEMEGAGGVEGIIPETLHTMTPLKLTRRYNEKTGTSSWYKAGMGPDEEKAAHIRFLEDSANRGVPGNDPRVEWSMKYLERATPPIMSAPDVKVMSGLERGGGYRGPAGAGKIPMRGTTIANRPPTESAAEVEKTGTYNSYVEHGDNLANRLEQWHANAGPVDRAIVKARLFAMQHDPTGLYKTLHPLPPELADMDAEMGQLVTDYENVKGGVRAVAQQAAQARLQSVHGGDISNPNSLINLRSLMKFMRDNRKETARAAEHGGRRAPAQPKEEQPKTSPMPQPGGKYGDPGSAGVTDKKRPSFKDFLKKERGY
jgi:hypothetical protein